MARSVFEIGNKITLQLIKRAGLFSSKDVDNTVYTSYLVHIESERELVIAVPLVNTTLLHMGHNDVFSVRFYTKNGIYSCKGAVIKTGNDGNIATANIRMISNFERYQRREYYRLECKYYVAFSKINEQQAKLYSDLKKAITEGRKKIIKEQIKMENIQFSRGLILDISGGGTKINCDKLLQKDDLVVLFPDIPELLQNVPYLIGKVIASKENPGTSKNLYEIKIKFINISNEEREKIITYIFAVEREKMRIS